MKQIWNADKSSVVLNGEIIFKNVGTARAYRLRARRAYAPMENLSDIHLLKDLDITTANSIGVQQRIIVPLVISQPVMPDGSVKSAGWYIYCGLLFGDSPDQDSNILEFKQWLVYPMNSPSFAFMRQDEIDDFGYFVNKAYKNRGE